MGDRKKPPYPEIVGGSIILYDYLWRWQQERGEETGRKTRESVVAIRAAVAGRDTIFLLPITSREPDADRSAFELPEIEVRRIRRGQVQRLWVIIDELNTDEVARSFVLEPGCKVGDLSRPVYEALLARLRAVPIVKRIDRNE